MNQTTPNLTKPNLSSTWANLNQYRNHVQQTALRDQSIYVIAVLTSDDVAIAILVAVLVLLGRFPGRRLSLRQGLNIHMYTHTHAHTHTEIVLHWGIKTQKYACTYGLMPRARTLTHGQAEVKTIAWILMKRQLTDSLQQSILFSIQGSLAAGRSHVIQRLTLK